MANTDIAYLELIANAVAATDLVVTADITGSLDSYELSSYIDEVVVLDSMGLEVVTVPKDKDD